MYPAAGELSKRRPHFGDWLNSLSAPLELLGARDGSVVKENATWMCRYHRHPAECMGPAYGSPMNSFRAEVYGLLSLLIYLFLVHQYANTLIPPVKLRCDNKALIEKADATSPWNPAGMYCNKSNDSFDGFPMDTQQNGSKDIKLRYLQHPV
jgi:hypothetical protein